jgi:hypothetical protein
VEAEARQPLAIGRVIIAIRNMGVAFAGLPLDT